MEILKNIAKLLTNSTSNKISLDIYYFLLAMPSDNYVLDKIQLSLVLSDSNRNFSKIVKDWLVQHDDLKYWNIELLGSEYNIDPPTKLEQFISQLSDLYDNIFPESSFPQTYQEQLRNLVFFQVFGTVCPQSLLSNYLPLGNYYIPDQFLLQIDHMLEVKNILVISGNVGIGKSYLANAYIKSNNTYKTVGWYTAPNDKKVTLKDDIANLKFKYIEDSHDVKLNHLKTLTDSTLLVIQHTFLNTNDYEYLATHMAGKNIRIIILTTKNLPEEYLDAFSHLELKSLPTKTLRHILTNNLDERFCLSCNDYNALFERIGYNVLALSLINKTIRKRPDMFTSKTLLSNIDLLFKAALPRISCTYFNNFVYYPGNETPANISGYNALHYFDLILEQYPLPQAEQEVLTTVALFCSSECGCPLELIPEKYRYIIVELENLNLVSSYVMHSKNEITYYKMSPLIASVICHQNCHIIENLLDILFEYCHNNLTFGSDMIVPATNLCMISYGILSRLHSIIANKPDMKKSHVKWRKLYPTWQKIVAQIHTFAFYSGFRSVAQNIRNQYLYFFYPHLKNADKKEIEYWLRMDSSRTTLQNADLIHADFRFEMCDHAETFKNNLLSQLLLLIRSSENAHVQVTAYNRLLELLEDQINICILHLLEVKDYASLHSYCQTVLGKLQTLFPQLNAIFDTSFYESLLFSYVSYVSCIAKIFNTPYVDILRTEGTIDFSSLHSEYSTLVDNSSSEPDLVLRVKMFTWMGLVYLYSQYCFDDSNKSNDILPSMRTYIKGAYNDILQSYYGDALSPYSQKLGVLWDYHTQKTYTVLIEFLSYLNFDD